MVLCDRIVLFHDKLPQGRRDAEILGQGMGMLPRLVLLPDATASGCAPAIAARQPVRPAIFAGHLHRRSTAAAFLLFEGETLRDSEAAKRMTRNGKFKRVRAA